MCSNRGTLVFVSVFSATLSIPSAAVANFVPGQGAIDDTLTNRQILLDMVWKGFTASFWLTPRCQKWMDSHWPMPEMDGYQATAAIRQAKKSPGIVCPSSL